MGYQAQLAWLRAHRTAFSDAAYRQLRNQILDAIICDRNAQKGA